MTADGQDGDGMHQIMKRASLGAVLLGAAGLTACGGSSGGRASMPPITPQTTVTSAAPALSSSATSSSNATTPESSSSQSSSTSSSTSRANPAVPSGAAPGAGGPRPADATPLTESTNAQYAPEPGFKSPSGKNGCEILTSGDIRCGSIGGSGGELFLTSDGQIIGPTADDAPMWPMPETSTLAYGQTRYSGNTVFASTDQGVTVWNTTSGHGALINTAGIHQF